MPYRHIRVSRGQPHTHIHKFDTAWEWLTSDPIHFASGKVIQNLTNRSSRVFRNVGHIKFRRRGITRKKTYNNFYFVFVSAVNKHGGTKEELKFITSAFGNPIVVT
jgi:hypothetical protein